MKIGKYKGLNAKEIPVSVTEEDVERVLANEQRMNSVIVQKEGQRIRILQKLDDDFAKDFSEYDTLKAWKEAIYEELFNQRFDDAEAELSQELLKQVLADSDIPVDSEIRDYLYEELYEDLIAHISSIHLDLDGFAQKTGRTAQQVLEELKEEADFSVRSQMALHEIARLEGITVSPDEVSEYLEGDEDEEEAEAIADELLMEAALAFIREHAVL